MGLSGVDFINLNTNHCDLLTKFPRLLLFP